MVVDLWCLMRLCIATLIGLGCVVSGWFLWWLVVCYVVVLSAF